MKNKIKAFIDECKSMYVDFEIKVNIDTVENVEEILFELGYLWMSGDNFKRALGYFNSNGNEFMYFQFNCRKVDFGYHTEHYYRNSLEIIKIKPNYNPKKITREL